MGSDVLERALARISVTAPYFALDAMEATTEGVVTAQVPHAPTTDPEVGEMEAAQVARHLAILGSCAAAVQRDDDERLYYLATSADYVRIGDAPGVIDDTLTAEAIATWTDRRSARAVATLRTAEGRDLHRLDCSYTVLKPRMFERFNQPVSPEIQARAHGASLGFDVQSGIDGIDVDCGPIPAALCEGHFPGHPAAPVAILMGQLCKAAGIGMVRHLDLPDHRYCIEAGHVDATGLAQAGQRLILRAAYDGSDDDRHRMSGVAEADGEVVGRVSVTMSVHEPADREAAANEREAAVVS